MDLESKAGSRHEAMEGESDDKPIKMNFTLVAIQMKKASPVRGGVPACKIDKIWIYIFKKNGSILKRVSTYRYGGIAFNLSLKHMFMIFT